MTITAKQLKDLIANLDDEEVVVFRIRMPMSSLEEDTIELNKVTYTEVVYKGRMPSMQTIRQARERQNVKG